jgi:hypothetical protein
MNERNLRLYINHVGILPRDVVDFLGYSWGHVSRVLNGHAKLSKVAWRLLEQKWGSYPK